MFSSRMGRMWRASHKQGEVPGRSPGIPGERAAAPGASEETAAFGLCPACLGPERALIGEKNGHDLARCRACGTVSVFPMPSPADLEAIYQGYATTPDYLRKKDKKVRRAKLRLRFLPVRRGMRFLDVGCNAGFAVAAALERGLDAHGIDIDEEAIGHARQWLPEERFQAISIEACADSGQQADFVYSSEVIEHVPDPESFVAALSRIVRPGGGIYLTCPDPGHFRRPRNFTDWNETKPPRHLVWYTRAGLRALFTRHGFTSIRFRPHTKPSHRMTARREKG